MEKAQIKKVINLIINANDAASLVEKEVSQSSFKSENIILIAIGKAAWAMALGATRSLKEKIKTGIVITKYGHSKGPIDALKIYEASHPILDEKTVLASLEVVNLVHNLKPDSEILFLISGGGSALFEVPLISLEELKSINQQLLDVGASINEINLIRKRFSQVKGGKFAKMVAPIPITNLILSDVIGDDLDLIASGPTVTDTSSQTEVLKIINKYQINLSSKAKSILEDGSFVKVTNTNTKILANNDSLVLSAKNILEKLGYLTIIIPEKLSGEARQMGETLAKLALTKKDTGIPLAIIAGGETVVTVQGQGRGGRNQELALAATKILAQANNITLISFGSDGTDGPTDAAGGIVSGESYQKLLDAGLDLTNILEDNNSYYALKEIGDLLITGPTQTNLNDVAIIIIEPII